MDERLTKEEQQRAAEDMKEFLAKTSVYGFPRHFANNTRIGEKVYVNKSRLSTAKFNPKNPTHRYKVDNPNLVHNYGIRTLRIIEHKGVILYKYYVLHGETKDYCFRVLCDDGKIRSYKAPIKIR